MLQVGRQSSDSQCCRGSATTGWCAGNGSGDARPNTTKVYLHWQVDMAFRLTLGFSQWLEAQATARKMSEATKRRGRGVREGGTHITQNVASQNSMAAAAVAATPRGERAGPHICCWSRHKRASRSSHTQATFNCSSRCTQEEEPRAANWRASSYIGTQDAHTLTQPCKARLRCCTRSQCGLPARPQTMQSSVHMVRSVVLWCSKKACGDSGEQNGASRAPPRHVRQSCGRKGCGGPCRESRAARKQEARGAWHSASVGGNAARHWWPCGQAEAHHLGVPQVPTSIMT